MAVAKGPKTADLCGRPRDIGSSPAIVVIVVSRIGRKRRALAMRTESRSGVPRARSRFTKSIRISESFTTMPARPTVAYITHMERTPPVTKSPRLTPMNAKARTLMTTRGCA